MYKAYKNARCNYNASLRKSPVFCTTGQRDILISMTMIPTPYDAPDFSLPDSQGNTVTLNDFQGSWLVLYFYPKDDTQGCTTQACSLRDARDDIASLGAKIVGISADDASSHEAFKAKHSLNFTLLTDADHIAMNAYGAWGKKMFGKEGILRKTFLIDPHGVVQKAYGRATPLGHGEAVVEELKRLQA